MGNTELALEQLPEGSLTRDLLEDVELSAERAAEITNPLLAYSGRNRFERKAFDLSTLVEEMTQLLRNTLSKKAVVKCEIVHDLSAIEGDPSQVRQLVMNLLINASDALADEPGEIAVTTGRTEMTGDRDGRLSRGNTTMSKSRTPVAGWMRRCRRRFSILSLRLMASGEAWG